MTREKRDENGMPLPVKTEPSPALRLPTAAEQRPKEDTFGQERTDGDTHGQERTAASGKKKPIGEEEIAEAQAIMKRYFNGKKRFDERYKDNFKVYNLLYNEQTDKQYQKDSRGNLKEAPIAKRIGGQTLNVILNKHADAMDNYPEPIFLAREQSDEKTANMLNSIVPCVLERNRFEKTYSEAWTDKLVGGADCIAVTWDSDRDFGLGDISISRCNILCLAWQPFVEDIQKSDHLFYVSYMDVEAVKKAYPALKDVSTEDLGLSETGLDRLIKTSYDLLGYISFLTAGEDDVHAWTIVRGTKAPKAAGKIHTDIERGFIRAEIVAFEDLKACGSMAAAKEKGHFRLEGKDYVMQDGDVTMFRFNV